jgi:phosphoribosylformylglycinamidine cyclo-ligase
MPDTYKQDDFDMAGFAVGVVERKKIISGFKQVGKGDVILGLASSGLHSNGYALARNICFKVNKFQPTDNVPELDGRILGDVLLEPTKIYVRPIIKLLSQYKVKKVIHGMARRPSRQYTSRPAARLRRGPEKIRLADAADFQIPRRKRPG